jgi:tetratricopeptide (TPR) repeat protein
VKPTGLLLAVLLALSSGCVYYNGMYNANRLANKAEKAERDGRRFDAQSYWAQAEVKADSVISQHPNSGWVDDALLIKSKALIIRGSCAEAVPNLERILFSSTDADPVEQANLLLGGCYSELGDPEAVIRYVEPVTTSPNLERRVTAQALYGSALNRLGRYQEALDVLTNLDDPQLDGERAIALAGSGRIGAAIDLADSLIARRDTMVVWESVLAAVALHDLSTASGLTDELAAQDSILPERRAKYYLDDGRRWVPVDPAYAIMRFELAAQDSAARQNGGTARVEWARIELSWVRTTEELVPILPVLEPAMTSGGADALLARRLTETIQRVRSTADTLTTESPNGDLEQFFLAETARDSLGATELARAFFQRLADDWPDSPYAPKALLVMAMLDADNAHVYRQYLAYVYPDSPYLSYLEGGATSSLRSLEDSLQAYAFSRVVRRGEDERQRQGRQRRARADVDDLNLEDEPPE